jgi:hypothetical protein
MATDPDGRLITVRYNGGYIRATKGAMDKLLGSTDAALEMRNWGPDPGARRPYGFRRRTNSAAGMAVKIDFADGESWTYRVAGPVKRMINRVLRASTGSEVVMVTTPRGAEFAQDLVFDLDP